MKTAQKTFAALMCLGALAVLSQANALAQDEEESDPRFHRGEFDLSGFGVYLDKARNNWGGGGAITWFPLKRLGVGASTYWTDFEGTFMDNVEGEAYLRLPLLRIVAPYIVGGVGYQFDRDYVFETIGLGIDFRPFKSINAFSDVQYRISNDHDEAKDTALVRLGLRFSF